MRKTIGVTDENRKVLAKLMQDSCFDEERDAALFAMAYAIDKDSPSGQTGASTIWSTTAFLPNKHLEGTLSAFYPGEDDYAELLQHLINEGCKLIKKDGVHKNIAEHLKSLERAKLTEG